MPQEMHMPIRVFVVDDHPVVRSGLRTMIESAEDFAFVDMAASAEEAMELLRNTPVDVVLLDLRMPGMDGLELLAWLRAEVPGARTVVLTNYHSDEDVFRAFQSGAMAYLLKSSSGDELLDVLRAAFAGERRIPPQIAAQLAQHLGRAQLSSREQEIMAYVAQGLTNREIGVRLHISDKTVRNHVIHCIAKLGARDRTEATALALQRGLIKLD
jgi:DNA-binding NarL/FixJ family response regulator